MADKQIGDLTDGGAAQAGDIVHAVRSGNSRKVTLAPLAPWTAASASGPAALPFAEDTDNGSHAVTVKAPASVAANVDVVLPGEAGTLAVIIDEDNMASDSATKVPSQQSVKAYVDALIGAQDAMVFKGVIDCSANPNYPAADRGWTYRVSVAGKIGGGSGPNVEVGDILLCLTDSTSSGNHATVGSSWAIIQSNLDGAVIGPASVTDSHFAQFDGTTGKLIKGGVSLDTDGTLAANSATRVPSQSAVKTYADTKQAGSSALTSLASTWTPASASGPAALAFAEDTDNGSHKVNLKAPTSLSADRDVVLPSFPGTLTVDLDGQVNVRAYGAVGDGSTDDTSAIQAAIAAAGSGGTVIVPRGSGAYRADGLRLDGSGGTLSGVKLVLMAGACIKARASASNNVVEAVTGSGHKVYGPGKISGSKDVGGAPVRPPSRGFWVTGTSYTIGDTVEVSSSDTATTSVAAANLVYECTSNHTAGATFLGDKATKWTLSADPNYDDADLSYRYRNGIYFGNCTDIEIVGVEIEECVYAGINLGSGPVQAANIGGALQRGLVTGNDIHDCENGIAGGVWQGVQVLANRFRALDVYGLVADKDANGNIISNNELFGATDALHAIFLYDAEHNTVQGNRISGVWTNGIVVEANSHYASLLGNAVDQVTNIGIYARNLVGLVCNDNVAFDCEGGIAIDTVTKFQMVANQAYANNDDGILMTSCAAGAIQGNLATLNGASGIRATSSTDLTIAGNTCTDNVSAGIRGTDSLRVTANDNACYDTRSGGSKTQVRGVLTDGSSDYWCVMGNMLVGNLTSETSLAGTHNLYVAVNDNGLGLGVKPTSGDGRVQLAAGTTKAAGVAFGNDTYLYRAAAGYLRMEHASDTNLQVISGSVVTVLRATAAGVCVIGTTTNHPILFRTNDTDRITLGTNGFASLAGSLGLGAPVTKTGNFTVADTENHLINNKSGSSCTVTLPSAASFPGRMILIKNAQTQTVVSASSNVVPLAGGAAGTAILSATAGRWALLVSDGTNWVIMCGVV